MFFIKDIGYTKYIERFYDKVEVRLVVGVRGNDVFQQNVFIVTVTIVST